MLKKLFVLIGLLVFFTACSTNYTIPRKETATLVTVLGPYQSETGPQVVRLIWNDFAIFSGQKFPEWGCRSKEWEAFPVEKIPKEIMGKMLWKKAEITYKAINDNPNPPVAYILEFKILE